MWAVSSDSVEHVGSEGVAGGEVCRRICRVSISAVVSYGGRVSMRCARMA